MFTGPATDSREVEEEKASAESFLTLRLVAASVVAVFALICGENLQQKSNKKDDEYDAQYD